MVVTTSPTCSLYRIVVLPAPSRPKIRILISREPKRDLKYDNTPPEVNNNSVMVIQIGANSYPWLKEAKGNFDKYTTSDVCKCGE